MKKTITFICIILVFFFIYFLQINFFSWFNIAGVKPNLFIVLVLFISLFIGKEYSIVLGGLFGLYLDLLASKQIGISAIMYIVIGLAGAYLDKSFSKDSKITILLMVAGSTFVFELATYLYICAANAVGIQFWGFVKILFIEILFNILISIIIFPIIREAGFIVENIFKKKKILTRYF